MPCLRLTPVSEDGCKGAGGPVHGDLLLNPEQALDLIDEVRSCGRNSGFADPADILAAPDELLAKQLQPLRGAGDAAAPAA